MAAELDFIHAIGSEPDKIRFIEGENGAKYPNSHSLLVDDILIDTGISRRRIKGLLKTGANISTVILSHWHEDHIYGNSLIPNAKFYCHPNDRAPIEHIEKMFENYGVKGQPFEDEFAAFFESFRLRNTAITGTLIHEQELKAANGVPLTILHTPGHTAGHLSIFLPKNKIMFVGDIDLSSFGPWYGCLDSNLLEFEHSIQLMQKYDIDIAVSSHKGIIEGKIQIQDLIISYLHVVQDRDTRILACIPESHAGSPGVSLDSLVGKNLIYTKYNQFEAYLKMAEKIMIERHLDKFVQQGKIERNNGRYRLK